MFTVGGKQYDFPHKFMTRKLLFYCVFNNFLERWSTGYKNEAGKQCLMDGVTEWEGDTSEWSTRWSTRVIHTVDTDLLSKSER